MIDKYTGKKLDGRYEIQELIGVGGMANVYRCYDTVDDREVAIKILKDEFLDNADFIRRFKNESKSIAVLSHPNIVRVYDVSFGDMIQYIVMEYIDGITLKEYIAQQGVIQWKEALHLTTQILRALQHAHEKGIVHRDIKPQNIMLLQDGTIKVTDFGIARNFNSATRTMTEQAIGSVHYIAPEQAKGGNTDGKTDIYSVGVMMYEMLTGRVPFDADTSVSVALKHMQESPVEPIEINENIPVAVNDIILKAMQKEPMARYQTATEMIKDLNKALKDPDGDFVYNEELDDGLTRRMDAITDDMLDKKNKGEKKKKNKIALFFEKHPKAKVPAIILLCLVLFGISLLATSVIMDLANPKEVQIPNLVNMTEEEAKAELDKLKIKYNKVNEAYSTEVEAGKIMTQDPPYRDNFKIKEKSTISVVISKGTETTTVPKVIGMKYDEAVKALEEAKLEVEKVEEASKTVEAGIVISQETAANTTANAGDKVIIHVSTGVAQAEVPSVMGKTEAEARTAITDKNLKVEVKYDSDTSKENGVVIAQSVNAGKEVDEGTTITITVNKFEETKEATIDVNVKSVTGGYDASNEDLKESDKKKDLKITVDGDTVYNKKVDLNSTTINSVTISGKGTVTVKVYVDGVLKKTKDLTLSSTSSYTFE